MGELSPILEGHLKIRDGKKWKNRYARITRLSPVADFLTLQLWRDGKETEKHPSPTKGSMSLSDYLGVETAFNLDKESNTMALIFRENIIIIALQSREILIKWQVRLTGQFEEGQQFPVHLVSAPKKGKISAGLFKLHLQNQKFSLTQGIPPVLVHTWNMIDLRRYGAVDGGRFCYEGGTRCGKGEGLHVFRVDNSDELQIAFDLASKGKLENKKRNTVQNFSISHSPSVCSSLSTVHRSGDSGGSGSPLIHNNGFGSVKSREEIQRRRSRSRSRSMNTSGAWSSLDNGLALSSPDTLSLTLSDAEQEARVSSPEHLVNRRAILDRIGMQDSAHSRAHNGSRSCGSESDFYLNWSTERGAHPKRQGSVPWSGGSGGTAAWSGSSGSQWSGTNGHGTWNGTTCQRGWNGTMDRMSLSSGESQSSGSNYDQPKTVLKVTTSPKGLKRLPSQSSRPISPCDPASPPLTPRSLRRVLAQQGGELDLRRQIAAAPCACSKPAIKEGSQGYENYDIPRNLGKQQEPMQFYDTPRNIREALGQQDGMGNYDIPGEPLPVFTKPCGCLMRLTSGQSADRDMTWTCVSENSNEESELKIPRVKLTGQGKMPVVDMSKINAIRCFSEPPKETNSEGVGRSMSPSFSPGLVPSSPSSSNVPVYAQIDRSKKSCSGCQQRIPHRCTKQQLAQLSITAASSTTDHTNYTNLDFAQSLSLYENSRDVLSRLQALPQQAGQLAEAKSAADQQLPPSSARTADTDYLEMNPKLPPGQPTRDYELMNFAGSESSLETCSYPDHDLASSLSDRLSLCSSNYDTADSMALMSDTRFDTIKLAPKNFVKIDDETFMYKPEKEDDISISIQSSNLYSGYVTIPRSKVSDNILYQTKSQSPNVTMRRSASVPCKRDRDSTSSGGSDSGVSTGSPRQSTIDQLESLDQLDSLQENRNGEQDIQV